MKRLLVICALALLLPAAADARDRRSDVGMRMQAQGQQQAKKASGPMRRGEADKRGHGDKRHQNRLTDDERRGLHKDLDRANREIYRKRQP